MDRQTVPRAGSLLDRLGPSPRVAVLRTGRLGDLVALTPALRALRAAVPGAHVTLLVNPRALPLARRLRYVDAALLVPELAPMARFAQGAADEEVARSLRGLRRRRFDLALQCAGGGETTNPFVRALGARFTAGQQWPDAPPLDLWMPFQRLQPEPLRLLDIMGLIGVPIGTPEWDVPVQPQDLAEIRQVPGLDRDSLWQGRLLGVHPGAGSGARCWPPERFAAVVDGLLGETDLRVVLTGGPDERHLAQAVRAAVRQREWVLDVSGQLSLGGLIGLLSQLWLFIGNDSGPAHLARALGVPSVTIYGSGHPALWAPPSRVWHRAAMDECAPCRRFLPPCGCPDDATAHCLDAVRVEAVLGQAQALLRLIQETAPTHRPARPATGAAS